MTSIEIEILYEVVCCDTLLVFFKFSFHLIAGVMHINMKHVRDLRNTILSKFFNVLSFAL